MHCCSQCNFTSQFASALTMHRQMVHGVTDEEICEQPNVERDKFEKIAEVKSDYTNREACQNRGLFRTNSAMKFFDKLKTRMTRSKQSISIHNEESVMPETCVKSELIHETPMKSPKKSFSRMTFNIGRSLPTTPTIKELSKECFKCHLCPFIADRITVLDRHLLNDHKIGLGTLLELVMAKTKEGIMESNCNKDSYYTSQNVYEAGEFLVETVSPKIKVLKHAAINTELHWSDIVECKYKNNGDNEIFMKKLDELNECMHECVESTNNLCKNNDSKSTVDSRRHFGLRYDKPKSAGSGVIY